MQATDIVLALMADQGVTKVELAEALGVSKVVVTQTLGSRNGTRRQRDITVGRLGRMLDILGYRLEAVPKGRRLSDGGYPVTAAADPDDDA